jgi:(S)-2-hydroxyglutarate dehydrogenase
MRPFDYAIIGGGIVGLSVGWEICQKQPGVRVAVLEKEDGWARHQTGRNSGVIHSGIYYKPGSLKAQLCREGNRRMRQFCDAYGIHYEVCGKLILATTASELPALETLQARGVANGLEVRRLTAPQVNEIEPHARAVSGLHVPCTGIVNYADVCRRLVDLIHSREGELRLSDKVQKLHFEDGGWILDTSKETLHARRIVNCAGLHSDRVAALAGTKPRARIVPFRGEYFELKPQRRGLVKHLIYPVPNPAFPFLGVHFTRMIDQSVHAGPNAVVAWKREGYSRCAFDWSDAMDTITYPGFWRLGLNHLGDGLREIHRSIWKPAFVQSLQRLVPEVQSQDLVPAPAGVRAQALLPNGQLVDDFLIVKGRNALHVCNAPSPAATAALAIGEAIVRELPELRR